MNCNEVTAILDDGRMDKLDTEQRRQVEAHKAGCVVCARGWNAQAAVAALPDLAMPAGLAMQCRAVVAAPRVESPRGGRKWVLVGSLTALAAAAAVIAFLLHPVAPRATIAEAPVDSAPEVAAPAIGSQAAPVATEVVPTATEEPVVPPRLTVHVLPPELPPELREGANPATPLIFNQADLEMIRRDITDPVRMQARQSVYSALVAELRKVPGLVVVNADPVDLEPSAHHYRITVGAQISMQPDFRVAPISSRNVVVALNAEQLQPGGKGLPRASSGMYVDLQENCVRIAGSQSTCVEIQSAAREFVNKLRLEAFPPEPAATRPLFARLEDSSLDVAQRLAALADLYKLQVKTGETGLLRNAGAVRAVIELAKLVDPAQRAQLWRSVRGVADPALVDALLLSLAQDPAEVRIAAIEALASGSRSDPRVRSTLEAVEISDARPLVRAIAGRALSGEETWRSYVASSLEDTSLSPEQRLEALVYYLYPPEPAGQTKSHPDFSQIIKDMDDNAVRAFADAMPRAGRLPGGVNNNLLGNFAAHHLKNPAINDMLLEMLGNHPDPRTRMGAVQLLGQSQPNVPRVRAALLKALQDDPDAGVRSYIRQVLGDKAP